MLPSRPLQLRIRILVDPALDEAEVVDPPQGCGAYVGLFVLDGYFPE